MSTSIDQAFVKQYEREVHEEYQRQSSRFRGTIRTVNNVTGSSTVFQKVGKGTAGPKSKHGVVPVMNLGHSNVECVLQDHYAGDWVDKLDELKINIDERQIVARAAANALGRKTDELIIGALNTSANVIAHGSARLTLEKILAGLEKLGDASVPDDGNRYCAVGYAQWNDLLRIDQFAKSDYVGPDELPFKGVSAKHWLGTIFFPHEMLPKVGNIRTCFWYHQTSAGHAIAQDAKSDITWHGDRQAHFIASSISQGAVLIDQTGALKIEVDESAAVA